MKKSSARFTLIQFISLFMMLILAVAGYQSKKVYAYETGDGFTYEIINGEAWITKYTGNLTNVIIPSEIISGEVHLKVAVIQNGSFSYNNNIETLIISEGIKLIRSWAFRGCNALTEIVIPVSTEIEHGAFDECLSIERFNVDSQNPYHQSPEGILFNKDATQLMQFPAASPLELYIFPDQTLGIAIQAFMGTKNLLEVILPEGMVDIPRASFYGATSIGTIHLSSKTQSIGDAAFYDCTSLISINLPETLRIISLNAFYNCDSLETIIIPENIEEIGQHAFYDSDMLSEIILPDSLVNLGKYAFDHCDSLSSVTIGSGLNQIPHKAFAWTNVKDIRIPGNISVIDDSAFYGSTLQNVVLESGIEFIGNSAFAYCNLVEVVMPESVSGIGEFVFYQNLLLEKVHLSTLITQIPKQAFANCINLQDIELHEGITSIGDYAFSASNQIHEMRMPSTLTKIGKDSFAATLREIYFYGNAPMFGLPAFPAKNIDTIYYKAGTEGWQNEVNLQGLKSEPFYLLDYKSSNRADLLPDDKIPYFAGESATIFKFPSEGNDETHYFKGWRVSEANSEVLYTGNTVHTFTDYHLNLEALWSEDPIYVVSFHIPDNKIIPDQYLALHGIPTEPELTPKAGYTLSGWYREEAFLNAWNINVDRVTADTALFAKWTINSYDVNFDSNGGSEVEAKDSVYNTLITAPTAPTRAGYTFGGWYKEAACTDAWDFSVDTVTADTTLYARWTINSYAVTFDSQGGSTVETKMADYDTLFVAPEAPERRWHLFGGWYKEATCVNAWNFGVDVVKADTTLYAKWIAYSYEIIFNSMGGTGVAASEANYDGFITEPIAPTKTGHAFRGWFLEADCLNAWDFGGYVVQADRTLYAGWRINRYDVTFDSQGGSLVAAQTANYNTTITVPAARERTGYTFGGWYKEAELINIWDFSFDTVTADTTLYARWTISSYDVTFDSQSESAITVKKANHNTTITAPAVPERTGYAFGGWYKEAACLNAWDFNVDRVTVNTTLYAKWTVVNIEATLMRYRTHVQNIGWQDYVWDGAVSGTTGQGLRLEGINIEVTGNQDIGVQYSTHIQNIGWQDYVSDGDMSGTSGLGLRLEAIGISLTGTDASRYDLYYRVHAENFGWLDWAKNGQESGTAGFGYRLEGIQVRIVPVGSAAPGSTLRPFVKKEVIPVVTDRVQYRTHVQDYGWQGYVWDGAMSGTSGEGKRLEGINIKLGPDMPSGNIGYSTHVQDYGWMASVYDGTLSGTTGEGKRLEGIRIALSGEVSTKYDVYYRVHAQEFGWLDWAKNGQDAGTAGFGYRLEGIEVQVLLKGSPAPGSTSMPFASK